MRILNIGRVLLILILVALIAGCGEPSSVTDNNAQNLCSQINALTCRTPSATGGVFCCINMFNQNAVTGYLCVLDRDQFAGCYDSLEQARQLGCTGTVVRCVRE